MAHHTTHRRILATPDHPNPPSMDPTLEKRPKPITTTTKNPDPTVPSTKPSFYMTNHLSRVNPNHKIHSSQKPTNKHDHNHPPPSIDIHLQAKAMTVSADSDSSKFLFTRPKNLLHKTVVPKVEKDCRSTNETSKDKVKETSKKKEVDEGLDVKKLLLVKDKQVMDLQNVKRVPVSLAVSGGGSSRRRSFCGSQVELAGILASCGVKIVSVDMPPFMQIHAVDFARKTYDSLEKFTSKSLALTLKKEFDGVYGPAWHCIVGTSFGSFVTHSVGGFLYFSMDQKIYILLFKTTVQRAD